MKQERRSFLKRSGMLLLGLAATGGMAATRSRAAQQSPRLAMIIDVNRCTGCHSCVIACKEQNHTPTGAFNTRIEIREQGAYPAAWQSYTPELCHQCQNAPCVAACSYGATFSLASGIVVTDWALCKGDGACVEACPYSARFQDKQQGNRTDKCDFCVELLEQGLEPACVDSCPSHARVFGDLANPQGEFAAGLKQLREQNPGMSDQPAEHVLYTITHKSEKLTAQS